MTLKLQDHVTNLKQDISTTAMTMTIKLGKVVIYNEEFQPIKSHDL